MKVNKISLRAYRSLYWANQGLLQAVRSLDELRGTTTVEPDRLRRTQAMIEAPSSRLARHLLGVRLNILGGFARHLPFTAIAELCSGFLKRKPIGAADFMFHVGFDIADLA